MMAPLATTLVAMSSTKGLSSLAGTAMARGLVPKKAFRPPHGAISEGELVRDTPIMSCSRAIMA